jgi:hypothetical protein
MRQDGFAYAVLAQKAQTTLYDDGDAHGCQRATSGEHWISARLMGVVHAVTNTARLVRWEVVDGVEFHLERGHST